MKRLIRIVGIILAVLILILALVVLAVNHGWTNVAGVIDHYFRPHPVPSNPAWSQGPEWQVFKEAMVKEAGSLNRAAAAAGVPGRLVMAETAVEQLRLYYTERGIFKQIFAPLKILGTQIQFSWGVTGMKAETAKLVEEHLKDRTSPYYLGPKYEHLLDFVTTDPDQERFTRLTDEKDHYWQYLYAGLYLKQVEQQWQKAGFDISNRPEILSTLFNIGFANSHPNADPQVGGAVIQINGQTYSFGGLAYEIYNSDELIEYFGR